MALLDKIKAAITVPRNTEGSAADDPVRIAAPVDGKDDELANNSHENDATVVADDAQHGVQTVEATTLAWSKGSLAAAFVLYVTHISGPVLLLPFLSVFELTHYFWWVYIECGSSISSMGFSPVSARRCSLTPSAPGTPTPSSLL